MFFIKIIWHNNISEWNFKIFIGSYSNSNKQRPYDHMYNIMYTNQSLSVVKCKIRDSRVRLI